LLSSSGQQNLCYNCQRQRHIAWFCTERHRERDYQSLLDKYRLRVNVIKKNNSEIEINDDGWETDSGSADKKHTEKVEIFFIGYKEIKDTRSHINILIDIEENTIPLKA
jgi:hypothetical protein